jgi:hypothetical protein
MGLNSTLSMLKIVLEPVPGRWRLRVLLLRFEPEERLWEKIGRVGSLVTTSANQWA